MKLDPIAERAQGPWMFRNKQRSKLMMTTMERPTLEIPQQSKSNGFGSVESDVRL